MVHQTRSLSDATGPHHDGEREHLCTLAHSLTVPVQVCNSLVGFRFLLDSDSGLHVADAVTEAPAARDVDDSDAAPLATAEAPGRLAATWAENPDAARRA